MVNSKNKNHKISKNSRVKASSAKIHTKKTRFSRRSRIIKRDRRIFSISRRTVLIVIALAMLAVILAIFFSILFRPEAIITGKIESMARDYYENYFYPRIEEYGTTDQSLNDILSRYVETGFSRVSLHQLLLFDSERYADSEATLSEYCDTELTYIKIYPDPPFTKTSYHIDYHYACTF